ncbi:MAG TPA: hypothetical protein VF519_17390 [Mycobacteriales bacterium]
MTVIPLKVYRIVPRKPWIAVDGGVVTFAFPAWFGSRTFSTPVANVGVVDLELVEEMPAAEETWFAEPLNVPYVYTTGPGTLPNLGLAFREPVAVPAFRLLVRQQSSEVAPKRSARGGRPAGRYLDGLTVRAVDPRTAVEALAAAGAERVTDPDAWYLAHRERLTDPAAIDAARTSERRFALAERGGWVLMGLGAVGLAAGGLGHVDAAGLAGGVLLGAGLLLQSGSEWLAERRAFRSRGRD